jgi:hypothetical protein
MAQSAWPDEIVEQLKQLASQGLSAAKAADQIPGMTRNAAVGLAFRRGFHFFGNGGAHTKVTRPADQPARVRKPRPKRAKPVKIEIVMELPRMVTLMELGDKDCRYMIGMPHEADHRYCGASGFPYCPLHRPLCYETVSERQSRAPAHRRFVLAGSDGRFR